jgi:hypothetical protein
MFRTEIAMGSLPAYVWVLVLIGVVGIPATTAVMLYRGALAARLRHRTAIGIAAAAAAGWAAWIVVSGLLAAAGAYRQDPAVTRPWIAVALLGALVAALLATRIPVVARVLADPGTPARLALPQTFRVVGGVFLIVTALGELPAVFALPAGLGDLAIGLSAPFVARRLRAGTAGRRAVWFTVLGMVDLVVAVGIGFLAGLGPSRLIPVSPATEAIGLLPLVLIPTTAVPLALALHIVTLPRLLRSTRDSERTAAA